MTTYIYVWVETGCRLLVPYPGAMRHLRRRQSHKQAKQPRVPRYDAARPPPYYVLCIFGMMMMMANAAHSLIVYNVICIRFPSFFPNHY